MEIQVKLEDLKKNKLFVATPMYGGMAHGLYIKSCLDLQTTMSKYGVETKFSFLFNESLITRARNYLVDEFGEYVFNVVSGTKQFQVTDPLEVLEIGTGYMMVKREVFHKMEKEYPMIRYKPDHVGQANFDGSRYIHAYFDTVIDSKGSITDGGSDRYLSEDYMFCQMWRKMGGTIHLCPWMKTQHIGTYAFTGNMPAVAQYTGRL